MNPSTALPPTSVEGPGLWGANAGSKLGHRGPSSFESFLPEKDSFKEAAPQPKKKSTPVLEFVPPPTAPEAAQPPRPIDNPDLGANTNQTPSEPLSPPDSATDSAKNGASRPSDLEKTPDTGNPAEDPQTSPLSGLPSETASLPTEGGDQPTPLTSGPEETSDFSKEDSDQEDSTSGGTESASGEEMVSLASYEDLIPAESATTDASGGSFPSDTSTISTSRAFQVSAASLPDSSTSASGQPAPTPANAQLSAHPSATTRAHVADSSGILKLLQVEATKLSQSSNSQIQLDLTVDTGDAVRIRLNLRGNDLFTTIATDSADLREALQKSWPEFLSHQKDRPYRFAESQFQDSFNTPDQRQSRKQPTFESPEDAPPASNAKLRSTRPVPLTRSNQPVQLWA